LRRTRFPRLALLLLAICTLLFLQGREPFRSHFWMFFVAINVAITIGLFFIEWMDNKRNSVTNCSGLTPQK
jgi:hypothetical protein